jgi:hypothetical protein
MLLPALPYLVFPINSLRGEHVDSCPNTGNSPREEKGLIQGHTAGQTQDRDWKAQIL